MDRQRRQQQEAAAAALHAALVCLNRSGVCREPLTLGMFSKPNPKGMQAVLHLLYHRIRGAARAKKELQLVYPVLEPVQAREFKAAMQSWVRELGAAGQVLPDTVKYFVTAYQGSNSHRTVLMLLDLSALALSKELGEGLHTMFDADLVQPHSSCGAASRPSCQAQQAAAAACREGQARLENVVAAMQRLRQLQAQAVTQLAAGRGAPGEAGVQLAPRVPPLFAASKASCQRSELVLELLSNGPPLTAKPEAVGPDSWRDLAAAGSMTIATARRLSNASQEASSFAAEGLAADADVLTVHGVLVQRLSAAGAVLAAACRAGPSSAELRLALAEAAAYRESLMLSVRQELAAAKVRAEQQAQGSSSCRPAMLQLLPPSRAPTNPVADGMQAAQEEAADAAAGGSSGSWELSTPAAVLALRRAMWKQAAASDSIADEQQGSSAATTVPAVSAAAASPALTVPAAAAESLPAQPAAAPAVPVSEPRSGNSQAHASPPRPQPTAGTMAATIGSPSLADMISQEIALEGLPLLSELSGLAFDSPDPGHQPAERAGQQQPRQLLTSPCMAESCASASVMGGASAWHSSSGSGAATEAAPAGGRHASGTGALAVAASPMLSAAASFMPHRRRSGEQQPQQQECGSLAMRSWRQAPAADTENASPLGSARRSARITFTLTPPRRLEECPQQQQQRSVSMGSSGSSGSFGSPVSAGLAARGGSSGTGTPASKLSSESRRQQAGGPVPFPVMQPVQQGAHKRQPANSGSPGSPLLASCLKSRPAGVPPLAFGSEEQPGRWTLAAARSSSASSGLQGSPQSSGRLRRSAVVTTDSPCGSARGQNASPGLHRLACRRLAATPVPTAAAAAAQDDLLGPPKALDTPNSHSALFSGGGAAVAGPSDTPGTLDHTSSLRLVDGAGGHSMGSGAAQHGTPSSLKKIRERFNRFFVPRK